MDNQNHINTWINGEVCDVPKSIDAGKIEARFKISNRAGVLDFDSMDTV